jgi:heat shock protein HtpX
MRSQALGTFGLQTYIWNNRLKSIILLLGFPVLLLLICFAFALIISATYDPNIADGINSAIDLLPRLVPVAIGAALIWFVIAFFANQGIIDAITGAEQVSRLGEPRLWNLLENLCISRGIPMPSLRVIDTSARNAFASGVRKGHYSITVTRGLIESLDDAELEGVLAHELTHIENRDVQLLVVAAVFVGVISLVGDIIIRGPRLLFLSSRSSSGASGGGWSFGGGSGRSRGSGGRGKGGGGLILILIAIAIFLVARLLAIALRFALSRKREFLADAGAVELTKNPDAMISALRKIEGNSEMPAPTQIQEMFLDHPTAKGIAGIFATHPSIDSRIAALVEIAGGYDRTAPGSSAQASAAQRTTIAPAGAVSETGVHPHSSTPTFGRRQTPPDDAPPDMPPGSPPRGPWT